MQQAFSMRMRGRPLGGGAPLDDYTTDLICCYGTIQLLSSYSGSLLRVSRSSDSAEQDIGQSGGVLDTTTMATFVGANDGIVEDFYDQVGASDLGKLENPQIIAAGVLNELGSIPAIDVISTTATGEGFDGLPTIPSGQSRTAFARLRSRSGGYGCLLGTSSGSRYAAIWQDGGPSEVLSNGVSSSAVLIDGVAPTPPVRRRDVFDAIASDSVLACKFTVSSNWTDSRVMAYPAAVLNQRADFIAFALYDGLLSDADIADISTAMLSTP